MKMVDLPDERGHFGQYGGVFVAEALVHALHDLRAPHARCPKHPDLIAAVESGEKALKDALNEAMRDWVTNVSNTFYIIGTVAGPHPYPMMVRDFQSVIGKECLQQMPEMCGRQPDAVIACVGGGSNAMGIFYPYIPHEAVKLIGVEAGGFGIASGKHAASLCAGRPGGLHGNRTYLLQDEHGQILETHSISAGRGLSLGVAPHPAAEDNRPAP